MEVMLHAFMFPAVVSGEVRGSKPGSPFRTLGRIILIPNIVL